MYSFRLLISDCSLSTSIFLNHSLGYVDLGHKITN